MPLSDPSKRREYYRDRARKQYAEYARQGLTSRGKVPMRKKPIKKQYSLSRMDEIALRDPLIAEGRDLGKYLAKGEQD